MAKNDAFLSRLAATSIGPNLDVSADANLSPTGHDAGPPWQLNFRNGRRAILTGEREDLKAVIDAARENDFTLAVRTAPSTEITDVSVALVARVRRVKSTRRGQLVYFHGLSGPLLLRRKHQDFQRLSGEFERAAKSRRRAFAVAQSPRDRSIDLVAPARLPKHEGTRIFTRRKLPEPDLSVLEPGTEQSLFDLLARESCPAERFRPARAPLCIPFSYPDTGCNARAHRMSQVLHSERRILAGKIWIFAEEARPIFTKNAPDWQVDWDVHVACVINVAGKLVVLDPSLFKSPQTIDRWAKAVDSKALKLMTASSVYTLEFSDEKGPFTIGTDPLGTRMHWELLGFTFKLTERVRTFKGAGPPFRTRQTS